MTNQSSATSNPQTAQKEAKTSSPYDDRRIYLEQIAAQSGACEYAIRILESVREFTNSYSPISSLIDMCTIWLSQSHIGLSTNDKHDISHVLRLIKFLHEIKSQSECFTIYEEAIYDEDEENE